MTVHSAKGLESRAVIYVASSSGSADQRGTGLNFSKSGVNFRIGLKIIKPDDNYSELAELKKAEEASEEKRLAYVTFTRAKELFYYIGADGSDGWKSFINLDKVFAAKRMGSVSVQAAPAGFAATG